jgi:hypothetical protein
MHFSTLSIPFVAVILSLALLSAPEVSAFTCSCKSNSFATEKYCFCDAEADKVSSCVKQKLPNVNDDTFKKDCPSPVSDPAGFDKCIQDRLPKVEDIQKSNQAISDCISSTGAKPSSVDDNPNKSSTTTPAAQSPSAQVKSNGFKTETAGMTLLSMAGMALLF